MKELESPYRLGSALPSLMPPPGFQYLLIHHHTFVDLAYDPNGEQPLLEHRYGRDRGWYPVNDYWLPIYCHYVAQEFREQGRSAPKNIAAIKLISFQEYTAELARIDSGEPRQTAPDAVAQFATAQPEKCLQCCEQVRSCTPTNHIVHDVENCSRMSKPQPNHQRSEED